jgi:cell wall-associated NlpC family hydrolase
MKFHYPLIALSCIFLASCSISRYTPGSSEPRASEIKSRVVIKNNVPARKVNTKNIDPEQVLAVVESMEGVPYKWGGSNKQQGFDCSGLIWYAFRQFNISVPRTSVEYTNAGKEVPLVNSRRGDIILFTGSDANSGVVGHMGMITGNDNGRIQFINAVSGEGNGVMYSKLSGYFIPRFVKVVRLFNESWSANK